jgi:uncharacterized protein (TIGR00297 family)
MGVGIPPVLISVIFWAIGSQYLDIMTIAFVSTLTVAAADTVASEIGVFDRKVWLITTSERVEPGTNGGISILGTSVSLVAALVTAIIGWLVIYGYLDAWVIIPAITGFIGNLLDSVLGATLENAGHISKYTNNCMTALMGAAIGMTLYALI